MSRKVYIPQLDRVYDSVAAAAAALGVSASGLSNVLSGRRRSVDGFNAIDASPRIVGGREVKQNIRGLRGRSSRSGYDVGVNSELLDKQLEFRKILTDVNRNTRALRNAGVDYFARGNVQALRFVDDIGRTKSGLYNVNFKKIQNLTDAEIDKYSAAIRATQKYSTYKLPGAERAARMRAESIGMSLDQVKKYKRIIPAFFDALDTANDVYTSDEIYSDVVDAMDNGASESEILKILARMDSMSVHDTLLYNLAGDYSSGVRNAVYQLMDTASKSGSADYDVFLDTLIDLMIDGVDGTKIKKFAAAIDSTSALTNDLFDLSTDFIDEYRAGKSTEDIVDGYLAHLGK